MWWNMCCYSENKEKQVDLEHGWSENWNVNGADTMWSPADAIAVIANFVRLWGIWGEQGRSHEPFGWWLSRGYQQIVGIYIGI